MDTSLESCPSDVLKLVFALVCADEDAEDAAGGAEHSRHATDSLRLGRRRLRTRLRLVCSSFREHHDRCVQSATIRREEGLRLVAARCPSVAEVTVTSPDITGGRVAKELSPAHFSSITSLDLSRGCLSLDAAMDESLRLLAARFPSLRHLNLGSMAVQMWRPCLSDASPLTGCSNLRTLMLRCTHVGSCAPFSEMKQLTRLDLSCTSVEDVSPLEACRDLRWLNLSGTRVRDVLSLAACTKLVGLDLRGTCVRDTAAVEAACIHLAELLVDRQPVPHLNPHAFPPFWAALNLHCGSCNC